jgi:hypothetical protein
MATTDITTDNITVAATPGATSKRGSTRKRESLSRPAPAPWPGQQKGRRPHSRLRRLRLHTIRHLDGRSIAARRAKAVVRELTQALGGTVTPMQLQAIERAAMHVVIAEDFAARRLAGEPVSLDETLRAEGVARRGVQAILANRPDPKPTERPGLALARARWAEQDAVKAKDSNHE